MTGGGMHICPYSFIWLRKVNVAALLVGEKHLITSFLLLILRLTRVRPSIWIRKMICLPTLRVSEMVLNVTHVVVKYRECGWMVFRKSSTWLVGGCIIALWITLIWQSNICIDGLVLCLFRLFYYCCRHLYFLAALFWPPTINLPRQSPPIHYLCKTTLS